MKTIRSLFVAAAVLGLQELSHPFYAPSCFLYGTSLLLVAREA